MMAIMSLGTILKDDHLQTIHAVFALNWLEFQSRKGKGSLWSQNVLKNYFDDTLETSVYQKSIRSEFKQDNFVLKSVFML